MNNNLKRYSDNQYPFGGILPVNVPAAIAGAGRWLRDRMYQTVEPEGYTLDNALNFVRGEKRRFSDPNTEALLGKYTDQDSVIAVYDQAPDGMPIGRKLTPDEERKLGFDAGYGLAKYAVSDVIIPSRSKEGAFEFAYPNERGNVPHLPYNASGTPADSWPHSHQLGTFHQVKGQDDKGTYVSYEDTWDINPFRGKSAADDPSWKGFIGAGKAVGVDKLGDVVPFGKPFELHGKQYYDKNGKPVNRKSEGGFFQPKAPWDSLSMKEKSDMIGVAVKNGITNLQEIRGRYNEYAKGGELDNDWSYDSWKRKMGEYKHLDIDNDNTYDYEGFFNKYPEQAWKMLGDDPSVHFTDEFKTAYHPTFSNQSMYSGQYHPVFNPQRVTGGSWDRKGSTYTMSPDGYRSPVGMDDRKWYLENAEDYGAQLRESNGSLPVFDGIPWGGVLPNVTVTGHRYAPGGQITYGQPFYSYDDRGRRVDNTLNYNATLPEVVITPDSQKTVAQRNEDERFRQRFMRDYAEQKDREWTELQKREAQESWNNSSQKKALDFGVEAAQGIGMASDVASTLFGGLPVYSGLKGSQALDRATMERYG